MGGFAKTCFAKCLAKQDATLVQLAALLRFGFEVRKRLDGHGMLGGFAFRTFAKFLADVCSRSLPLFGRSL
jgi:hypothetical protein